jgi:hypothetical protein
LAKAASSGFGRLDAALFKPLICSSSVTAGLRAPPQLHRFGHRSTLYTFLDDKRNVCLATDAYEQPTHDPHDSYFLQWLQTYDMVSHLETYVAPTTPVTIPELGWTLRKPTVYVVRVQPAGNTTHTTARYKESKTGRPAPASC